MRRFLLTLSLVVVMALVSASAAGAQVGLTPASADFGPQAVGTQSTPKAFTLSNGPFSGPYNTDPFATDPFRVISDNCPSTLATNASCVVNVVFFPKTAGAHSGELVGNATTGQPDANLTGVGTAAASGKGKKCKKGKKGAAAAKKKKCKKGKK